MLFYALCSNNDLKNKASDLSITKQDKNKYNVKDPDYLDKIVNNFSTTIKRLLPQKANFDIKTITIKHELFLYGTINNHFVFLSVLDLYQLLSEGYELKYINHCIVFETNEVEQNGLVIIKKRSLLYTLDQFIFNNLQGSILYNFCDQNDIYIIPILFEFLKSQEFFFNRMDIKDEDDIKVKEMKLLHRKNITTIVDFMDKICKKIKSSISLEHEDKIRKLKIFHEIIHTIPKLEEIPEDVNNMLKVLMKEAETSAKNLNPNSPSSEFDNIVHNIGENIGKKIKNTFFDITSTEKELFIAPYIIYNKILLDKNTQNYLYCYINQKQNVIKLLTSVNIKEIYYEFKKVNNINLIAVEEYMNKICQSITPNVKVYFSFDETPYFWLENIELLKTQKEGQNLKINVGIGLTLIKILYCYFEDLKLLSNGQIVSFLKQLIKITNKFESNEILLSDLPEMAHKELESFKNFINDQLEALKIISSVQDLQYQKYLLYETQMFFNISEIFNVQKIICKNNNFVFLGITKNNYNTVKQVETKNDNIILISSEDLKDLYKHGFTLKNTIFFFRKISEEYSKESYTQTLSTIYSLENFLRKMTKYEFEIVYLPDNQFNEITIKTANAERSFDIRLLIYEYLKDILEKDQLDTVIQTHELYKELKNQNIKKISEKEMKEFKLFVNEDCID